MLSTVRITCNFFTGECSPGSERTVMIKAVLKLRKSKLKLGVLKLSQGASPRLDNLTREQNLKAGRLVGGWLSLGPLKGSTVGVPLCTLPPRGEACPLGERTAAWAVVTSLTTRGGLRHSDTQAPWGALVVGKAQDPRSSKGEGCPPPPSCALSTGPNQSVGGGSLGHRCFLEFSTPSLFDPRVLAPPGP